MTIRYIECSLSASVRNICMPWHVIWNSFAKHNWFFVFWYNGKAPSHAACFGHWKSLPQVGKWKPPNKDLCWHFLIDQRTSCVPSIQRGSPSQPVPLIFGMTCAGIGGIGKMSRSGPTRPYSLMLPSGNWIHLLLWENFWRCFTGFARRTALLKCLNKWTWKYMQISHSIATWSVFAAVPGSCGPSTQLLTWSASALQSKLMGRMCKKTLA